VGFLTSCTLPITRQTRPAGFAKMSSRLIDAIREIGSSTEN